MNKTEIESALQAFKRLIPPPGLLTTLNGIPLFCFPGLAKFHAALTTEVSDADGYLTKATRTANVDVYRAVPGEGCPAAIYEMGIPVCEIDGDYIFNVGQKVPLTMDREEVLPSFRKQLAVAAVNNIHGIMDSNNANTTWATDAATSPDIKPEALAAVMTQKFGIKRVIYDPSDTESNSRAAAEGYTVITGGQLSKAAWNNVRTFGTALPAGQVTPSPKPYDPNGDPLNLVKEVTPGMREVEQYAIKFARVVLGAMINVTFAAEVAWPYAATYGPGHLTFNVGCLGNGWFDRRTNQEAIDDLIIHEFGHHTASNHLSADYYKALTRIGSKLTQAVRAGKL